MKEIFDIAKQHNGIRATIDRFEDRFDNMLHDNSYNWCDVYQYPLFEIRQDKDTKATFIWIKENQNTDPRCGDYLDENCIIFIDVEDFYDFCEEIKTEGE